MASPRGPNEEITATRDGDGQAIQIWGWRGANVQTSLALAAAGSDTFDLVAGHFYEMTAETGANEVSIAMPTGTTAIKWNFDAYGPLEFKVLLGQFGTATTGTMTITNNTAGALDFYLRELL